MSIEAQALGRLITAIEVAMKNYPVSDQSAHIKRAVDEAKYWVSPVQTFRDFLYEVWEQNQDWPRSKFLDHVASGGVRDDDTLTWQLYCICLGDMNYRVENEGFIGWVKAGYATNDDFETLTNLCRHLKTPVGYKAASVISAVKTFYDSNRAGHRGVTNADLVGDLQVLTEAYLAIRYDLLVDVERKLRQDVPLFQPQPPS